MKRLQTILGMILLLGSIMAMQNTVAYAEETIPIENVTEETLTVSVSTYNRKNKTVTLSWNPVEDALFYDIYQKDQDDNWNIVKRVESATAKVTLQSYGVTGTYKIAAMGENDAVIVETDEVSINIPRKISSINTTSKSVTKVKIAWTESKGATSYVVYRKVSGGNYYEVGTTKKLAINVKVKKDKTYVFKVVPQYVNESTAIKGFVTTKKFKNKEFVSLDYKKYTYTMMLSDMKALADKYSDYMTYTSIGESEEGRDIYDIVIGNQDAKKTLLVVAELHAREYVVSAMCMKQVEYYLMHYNKRVDKSKISNALSDCNIHFIVMANPDGAVIAQGKKTSWKANGIGIDLNRNYPYKWKCKGSTKYGTYTGSKAGSAKETKAIMKLTKKLKKTTTKLSILSYHAMGEIVFGDYDGDDKTVKRMTKKMYQLARKTTGYDSADSYSGSTIGNYREYVMYKLEIPAITVEVGHTKCPISQKYYNGIFRENKLLPLRLVNLL